MYLRVNPTIECGCGFGIDLVAIEFESGNRESESFGDISPYSDNLPMGIVCIGDEVRCGFPDNRDSSDTPSRRDLYPSAGFIDYPVIRYKTGRRTEYLFLPEFVVDINRSVRVFRAHFVNGGDIECVLHRYLQTHRSYIDRVLVVEYTRFFLGKNDISRYRFDPKLRRYRHIGFGYGEVKYEGEKRKGNNETDD